MKSLVSDIKFIFYILVHPFDGFYEARFIRRKNYFLITLIYALCGFTEVIRMNYSGFMVRSWNTVDVNNIFVFAAAIFPYIIFAVGNWSVTTLFDGNGKISDILMTLAYAMVPKIFCTLAGVLISNFVIREEIIILNAFIMIGTVYFVFITFVGLCVVHEYTASKTIGMAIATVLAMLILIFILLFYVSVMGKILSFVTTVLREVLNHISM